MRKYQPSARLPSTSSTTRARPARDPSATSVRIETILRDYGAWLRHTLTRLCPRDLPIDVDDVYQEVTIRLWNVLKRESDIEHLPSYLYRVASTATIDAVRRVTAKPKLEVLDERAHPRDGSREETSPERLVVEARLAEDVREILAGLPVNRRRAVALHLQGFTTGDVAELLGWREPKARNLVYRGLKDLRAGLRRRGVGS